MISPENMALLLFGIPSFSPFSDPGKIFPFICIII